jgi:hypothetical protein
MKCCSFKTSVGRRLPIMFFQPLIALVELSRAKRVKTYTSLCVMLARKSKNNP